MNIFALGATCKHLHVEAGPLFYACNSFAIFVRSDFFIRGADQYPYGEKTARTVVRDQLAPVRKFLDDIGHADTSAMRDVMVNLRVLHAWKLRETALPQVVTRILRKLSATAVENPGCRLRAGTDFECVDDNIAGGVFCHTRTDCTKLRGGLMAVLGRLERAAKRQDIRARQIMDVEEVAGFVRGCVDEFEDAGEEKT